MSDMLNTAGPQAAHIEDVWWIFLAVCCVVYALVGVAVIAAVARKRSTEEGDARPQLHSFEVVGALAQPYVLVDEKRERRMRRVVAAAAITTAVVLVGLLVASGVTSARLSSLDTTNALVIEITGHQYWWQVRYPNEVDPNRDFQTANEVHVPVGVPVVLKLKSSDVIHSLWVPSLHGKRDLIPGRTLELELRVDEPGVYRGQCAEFCGFAHAKMGLLVIAESSEQFAAWRDHQLTFARPPVEELTKRGQDLFMQRPCATCHAIRGTQAAGVVGPDLTHLASRTTLASVSLANDHAGLATWIGDAQSVKPGSHMPSIALTDDERAAIVAYLESLR